MRRASALLLCSFVVAAAASARDSPADPESRILDVRAMRFVTERELVARLAIERYRLLGEVHDNPQHHVIRARLIAALAAKGLRPAIVFEQFDLDHDAALVAAQRAGADAEQIAEAGAFDRKGWQWPMHKPMIEAALDLKLPVRAANVPRAILRADPQSGSSKDTGGIWYARFHAAHWSEAQAAALRADIVEGHCGKLPEAVVPRIVLAQRIRDAAMAQALVNDATADGAILIAGNGHVRADLGVPVYLHAPGLPDAAAQSISLALIEVAPEDERSDDFPRATAGSHLGFDYMWFTRPAPREDPCANIVQPAR